MVDGQKVESREAILDAAFGRFARYGYRRTSLGDIAEDSGLSRPALYHYFRNKEDVFRALSHRINAGVVAAVTEAAQQPDLRVEDRLYEVLAARVSWAFDLLHASEHGHELIDEKNRLCGEAGAQTNARFIEVLEAIIARAVRKRELTLAHLDMTAAEAATFLVDCLGGVVGEITTEAEARRRLRALARMFARGLVPVGD
jgi:AcrR family transcriptional regulator